MKYLARSQKATHWTGRPGGLFLTGSASTLLVAALVACSSTSSNAGSQGNGGQPPTGSGGSSAASSGAAGRAGNSSATGGGSAIGTAGSAGSTGTAGGNAASGGGTSGGASGSGAGGASGAPSGSGGGSGAAGTTGAGGGAVSTVELIGPGGATCGATNATHGDGFICVLNYPNAGANVVGYWFDYAFSPGTCTVNFTKPAGNSASNPQVCFSGSTCAATSGGGLGLALCDVHGIDVSTWPQLMMLESTSSLSPTAKSPFSGCNVGATMTSVNWTVGSGSIPAGTSVLFDDAADVDVARVDNLPAGATSVTVPANVDTSKVASIKFSVSGANSTSWNFCLSSLKVSLH